MKSVLGHTSMGYRWITARLSWVSHLGQWGKTWGDRLGLLSLTAVLAVIMLVGSTPALAVPSLPPDLDDSVPAASPSQPDANDIPSETVSRFVNAYIAVVKLIESREPSLQRAETDTESRQMQQEIQAAALDLIQANDLTLSAYWELLGLANSDPEFRDRVLAQIDEANP